MAIGSILPPTLSEELPDKVVAPNKESRAIQSFTTPALPAIRTLNGSNYGITSISEQPKSTETVANPYDKLEGMRRADGSLRVTVKANEWDKLTGVNNNNTEQPAPGDEQYVVISADYDYERNETGQVVRDVNDEPQNGHTIFGFKRVLYRDIPINKDDPPIMARETVTLDQASVVVYSNADALPDISGEREADFYHATKALESLCNRAEQLQAFRNSDIHNIRDDSAYLEKGNELHVIDHLAHASSVQSINPETAPLELIEEREREEKIDHIAGDLQRIHEAQI